MSGRANILRAVRAQPVPAAAAPDLNQAWITFPDRSRQFASVLESVGGRCVFVPDVAAAERTVAELPVYAAAKKIVTLVPGVGQGNVALDTIDDPHALEDVDIAILPGQFGVAENGAIWVTDAGIRQRVIYFLVQHLVLALNAGEIVDNMHQAYTRLRFDKAGFGVFISGPSKTADIEQSLVIGAHGPRSLTVVCVG